MSQRDDYRALRLDSVFQSAVSDYAVSETSLPAEINRVVIPASAQASESALSAPVSDTFAVSAVAADAPAALRPYEPIAADGVIAAWEAAKPIHLRGQAVGEAGSTVTLTFNDQSWVSTVNKWGYWNASMPPEVLKGLPDGNYSLKLTITDKAGNSQDTSVDFGLYVDKTIKPTVTIDTVSGDNAVNYAESIYGVDISGTSTHMASGSKITLKLGAISVMTSAASDGTWTGHFSSQQLQELQDGVHSLSVTAVDPNGKTNTVTHELTLITHLSSVPNIYFDKVTDDNVINLVESQHDLLFSGSLSTVTVGQELILQGWDGKDHSATIDAQGHWQVLITAADMPGFTHNGEIHAWYHDGANNYTDTTHDLKIVTGFLPVYYEMSIGGDMTLNYQEAQKDLSFFIEGLNELEINGKTYQPDHGMVTLPSADLLALAEGPVTALAHRWDEYGNSDTTTLTDFFNVATHNLPTLTLNTPFDDHVVDADDVNTWHLLQGTSTHLDQGTTVTLTLGDQSYNAAVKADGRWALTIPAGALAPLDDGDYELKVTAHDSAGNTASAGETVTVASHLNALNMDALLDFYSPAAAQDETSTGAVSIAQSEVVATPSHVAAAPIDSNLVSDAPYTLADHLLQHNAVLV
ncbi:Ig-like domain-containing protein [Erwinia pyri]|uniref:Ig-like domain-containing protein n=1 Tax=Erwinia pyri TaxID=3062598 RepID=A0AA50DRF0_9GAMM|nr:Ig-like domain-containing protein [Erwinia sp. DE2]WLS80835.1 Ig-like domain-containing protein [Erwinia sp. DE2]